MIFDGANMFFNKETLTGSMTSDVVNVGPGESYQPMFLEVLTPGADEDVTVTIQTAADAAFTNPVTLGTMTGKSQPMPRGNLGYLRLTVSTSATKGTITAGLVVDDDVSHRQ
jgi:hypothetical protein